MYAESELGESCENESTIKFCRILFSLIVRRRSFSRDFSANSTRTPCLYRFRRGFANELHQGSSVPTKWRRGFIKRTPRTRIYRDLFAAARVATPIRTHFRPSPFIRGKFKRLIGLVYGLVISSFLISAKLPLFLREGRRLPFSKCHSFRTGRN